MILHGLTGVLDTKSKPRASGDDPGDGVLTAAPYVVNPARAGMIPLTVVRGDVGHGKPRASGDDPYLYTRQKDQPK